MLCWINSKQANRYHPENSVKKRRGFGVLLRGYSRHRLAFSYFTHVLKKRVLCLSPSKSLPHRSLKVQHRSARQLLEQRLPLFL